MYHYARTLSLVKKGGWVADIAAGYDNFALVLAKNFSAKALVNDITCKSVAHHAQSSNYEQGIFSSIDGLDFDSNKVDLMICKNVLHHMDGQADIVRLLENLKESSHSIVLIDAEDPSKSVLGKIWNFYYRKFLLDQGHAFLDFRFFKEIVISTFPGREITFEKIRTLKGNFMMAIIES